MKTKTKAVNGHKPTKAVDKPLEHKKTLQARQRVLMEARKAGIISNERACEIGGWEQAWYHLNAMLKAGLIKHAGYNLWVPVKKPGRQRMIQV